MAITRKEGLNLLLGGSQGNNPYAQGEEAQQLENLRGKNELAVANVRANAMKNLYKFFKGPQQSAAESSKLAGELQKLYGPLSDQINASNAALDLANNPNAPADQWLKLLEAKASGVGANQMARVADIITGGKVAGGDLNQLSNWVQSSANPVLTDQQRNAIRETIFTRAKNYAQQKNQLDQQAQAFLMGAPMAQDGPQILNNMAYGVNNGLGTLSKAQKDYEAQMANMKQAPITQPVQANPNESTLGIIGDKLKSLFSPLSSQQQAPAQTTSPTGPHGDSVIQGGVTYKWNPQTGKYE